MNNIYMTPLANILFIHPLLSFFVLWGRNISHFITSTTSCGRFFIYSYDKVCNFNYNFVFNTTSYDVSHTLMRNYYTTADTTPYHYAPLHKQYEFSNHLGNVLVTVSAKPILVDSTQNNMVDYKMADVMSVADYYPFGSLMPSRHWNSDSYKFGFNGMEKITDWDGKMGTYDFDARMYNALIGRWMSVDPFAVKYPSMSPYNFVASNPILFIDPNGKEIWIKGPDDSAPVLYIHNATYNRNDISEFIKTTASALDYLINSGIDNMNIVSILVESKYTVSINEISWDAHANQTMGRIEWSQFGGIVTDGGGRQSPVTGLLHELGEAYFELYIQPEFDKLKPKLEDFNGNEDSWNNAMDQYDENIRNFVGTFETLNDFFVIQFIENPAAENKGDDTRDAHSYIEKYKAKEFKSLEGPTQSEIDLK